MSLEKEKDKNASDLLLIRRFEEGKRTLYYKKDRCNTFMYWSGSCSDRHMQCIGDDDYVYSTPGYHDSKDT